MKLMDALAALGDRLGILEVASKSSSKETAKIQTRTITLVDLMAEIRGQEIQALAESPAELSISFDAVYDSAGVKAPPHGWTVERLKQLVPLDSDGAANKLAIQRRLLEVLADQKVDVSEIVKDAVARDSALDAFEACVGKKVEERLAVRERQIAELEAKLQALHSEVSALKAKNEIEQRAWQDWRKRKRDAEVELARVVAYLIDGSVITISE